MTTTVRPLPDNPTTPSERDRANIAHATDRLDVIAKLTDAFAMLDNAADDLDRMVTAISPFIGDRRTRELRSIAKDVRIAAGKLRGRNA